MSDLPDLKKMIGPLPLGGWIAVVGLGVGASVVVSKRAGGTSTSASSAPPAALPLTDYGYGATSELGTSNVVAVGPSAPQTNAAWIKVAVETLSALRRPYSGFAIGQALGKFTSGGGLTDNEQTIVDDALRYVGYPPEGSVVGPDRTPPVPLGTLGSAGYEAEPADLRPNNLADPTLGDRQLGAKRTRVLPVAGRANGFGETPAEIAARVYGTPAQANFIHWFNRGVWTGDNSPIKAGTEIAY